MTPRIVLLMGVAGSGKSTTGQNLARHLGWEFRDADTFHPPANIAKMKSGAPLTDEDRWPWLDAIGSWVDDRRRDGGTGIVSCSALRRRYRDRLREGRPEMALVFLDGSFATIAERMQRRKGHFMPPALLQSQFDTLERPGPDEHAVQVSVTMAPRKVVERIVKELRLEPSRLLF
jgi:carbohydrate kinase (thermoresistant glucokinase family)